MRQMFTVFRFEYREWLKNKSFRITTIVLLAFIAIGMSIPSLVSLFSTDGSSTSDADLQGIPVIAVADQSGLYQDTQMLSNLTQNQYQFTAVEGTTAQLQDQIQSGVYEAALLVDSPSEVTLIAEQGLDSTMNDAITALCNTVYQSAQLEELGLDAQQSTALLSSSVAINTINVSEKDFIQSYVVTYIMILILFISIVMYGQMVAMSVAGEKSTHCMEVLITTTKPTNLIFGKVFAACCAGLTQLVLAGVVGVLFYEINKSAYQSMAFLLPLFGQVGTYLLYMILYFILGFFSYSFIFAAMGSTVSRVEDLNSSMTPVMLLCMLSFFAGFYIISSPDSAVAIVCSFVPFLSPIAMFIRICMSNVGVLSILLSVAINLATIVFAGIISAKIYKRGVLMYGASTGLKSLRNAQK